MMRSEKTKSTSPLRIAATYTYPIVCVNGEDGENTNVLFPRTPDLNDKHGDSPNMTWMVIATFTDKVAAKTYADAVNNSLIELPATGSVTFAIPN
jgi:hypothetical protein